jgi:hypothetical protein
VRRSSVEEHGGQDGSSGHVWDKAE